MSSSLCNQVSQINAIQDLLHGLTGIFSQMQAQQTQMLKIMHNQTIVIQDLQRHIESLSVTPRNPLPLFSLDDSADSTVHLSGTPSNAAGEQPEEENAIEEEPDPKTILPYSVTFGNQPKVMSFRDQFVYFF